MPPLAAFAKVVVPLLLAQTGTNIKNQTFRNPKPNVFKIKIIYLLLRRRRERQRERERERERELEREAYRSPVASTCACSASGTGCVLSGAPPSNHSGYFWAAAVSTLSSSSSCPGSPACAFPAVKDDDMHACTALKDSCVGAIEVQRKCDSLFGCSPCTYSADSSPVGQRE